MKNLPTIRIKNNYLLEDRFELPKLPEKVVKEYEKAWFKDNIGERILRAMTSVTGLTFAQNIIDVYIVNPDIRWSISDPMILGGGIKPSEMPRWLAHELIHRLAADNTTGINWHFVTQKVYKHKYKKESISTLNHVMIHAILEAIYTKLGLTNEIIHDIEDHKNNHNYARAWEIVEAEGYQKIIEKISNGIQLL